MSEETKLFIGGLSWGTTDDSLKAAFEKFGDIVDAKVISDRNTGRSRGFGFVTFQTREEATQACEEVNGTEIDGRQVRVDIAQKKSQERRDRDDRDPGRYGGNRDYDSRRNNFRREGGGGGGRDRDGGRDRGDDGRRERRSYEHREGGGGRRRDYD